jgi:hypothetical protein
MGCRMMSVGVALLLEPMVLLLNAPAAENEGRAGGVVCGLSEAVVNCVALARSLCPNSNVPGCFMQSIMRSRCLPSCWGRVGEVDEGH